MIKIIGIDTGKIYVKGTRSYCFRELDKQYPNITNKVYPEPLMVVRI